MLEREHELIGKVDPETVIRAVEGVRFPCSTRDLIEHTRSHNVPGEIQAVLSHLPEEQYNNLSDVRRAVIRLRG